MKDYRLKESAFTRKGKLSFPKSVLFMMNMVRNSLQSELNRFFEYLGESEVAASKQAFSKRRQDLSEKIFTDLNTEVLETYYTYEPYQVWKDQFRLIGIDGSCIQLPDSKEIRQEFGFTENQHDSMPMARISCAYDLLNHLCIDSSIGRYQHTQETKKDGKNLNERAMALSHIEQITQQDNLLQGRCFHEKDLYLFDMGYPALYFIAYLIGQGKDFVFRCSKSFLREVQEVIAQGTKDQVIEIPLKTSRRNFPEQLKTLQTPFTEESVIPLRVLLVPLESGETEVLLTSLTDKKRYHYNDFKEVYHLRWGSETYYSFLKESLQLENFTGLSSLSVKQDLFATIFTSTLTSIVAEGIQEEIEKENQTKDRKHQYKLNRNIALGELKNALIKLVIDAEDIKPFYQQVRQRIKRSVIPIREDRSFPRKKKKSSRKYHMTKKSAF